MLITYIIEGFKSQDLRDDLKRLITYILLNYEYQFMESLYAINNKSQT